MKYSLEYLSIGCNKISGCSDWGTNGIFLYCGHRSIVLYKPEDYKPLLILNGHEKRVNTVKWIPNGEKETEIVSGGSDSKVIVWKDNKIDKVLTDNKGSITSVACLYVPDTKTTYIASTSTESLVVIWERTEKEWKKHSTINFGKKMMECCSFGIYEKTIFLACGGLDDKIHLFVKGENEFTKKCELKGHQDWIRCLDFKLKDDGLYLASGSQDTKIRLWKVSKETKHSIFQDKEWAVSLEALLIGHEEWVHTVKWHPNENKIISSSMDRSMIIWEPEKSTGIWMNQVRMGEFGGLSGLFGQLGYFGCHFSPDGKKVLSHGYNGSFHLWQEEENKGWRPQICISGHFSDVMDISWDPSKNYFMSVSLDQTCRLFSYFEKTKTWHEIARPQVHGYDLNCFSFINNTEHKFISGADEKVVRVFEAPQTFLTSLENISGIKSDKSIERPVGASVPQLGLSNKGVSEEVKETEENVGFKPTLLQSPPLEDDLLQNTLWPEVQKLYGHANEMYALASSNNGKWIASACKSKKADQAQIIIWDTSSWKQLQTIKSHSLTVSQMCFSPNDEYLVSVSRDRTVYLYKRVDDKYEIIKSVEGGERIIWGCSFSDDGKYILTGSRDGSIKIFDLELNVIKSFTTKESITSVEFLPSSHLFSIGFENGGISIFSFEKELISFDPKDCACETIRRLKWRKTKDHLELLVCSTDHSIRLYHIFE